MFKHQFKAGRTSKTYFYKRTLAQIKKNNHRHFLVIAFLLLNYPFTFSPPY